MNNMNKMNKMNKMNRQPNIILINCDDLGYGDLQCYGSPNNKTPYLDELCATGLKMTDYYAASPVCSPSRGAMLTGCYHTRIGFGDFEGYSVLFPGQGVGLAATEKTLGQLCKEQGYATMCVGKWHCGDQPAFLPLQFGFDHYYGLPYSNDMGRQQSKPSGDQLRTKPLPLIEDNCVIEEQPDQETLTARYTEVSRRFIRQNADRPFFLYLAHMHVHVPHYPSARFARESENGDFGACVAELDWSTGAIVHELTRLGLRENTLIIFTSDNGGNLMNTGSNAPLRGTKGTTWEGGLRVPCIINWPGQIKPGVSHAIMTGLDFYASFAALTGGTFPEHKIDSMDMTPVWFGEKAMVRDTFFYYDRNALCAVRHGDWKLHVARNGQPVNELYNLRSDIGEQRDVYEQHAPHDQNQSGQGTAAANATNEVSVIAALTALAARCRDELGDSMTGQEGTGVRAKGVVRHPVPLTEYDPNHPYIIAIYDKDQCG